jgi:hypothetical protein
MAVCPKCGKEIRYIPAAPSMGGNGIIPVEIREEELVTEKGRRVRGYRAHECAGKKVCSRRGITPDICHAYSGGECANLFVCGNLLENARGC